MKKHFKIFCLILVFMLVATGCVKRRYDQLEARRKGVSTNKGKTSSDNFNPDDIDKFDVDSYLIWYKNLENPPKLDLEPSKNPKPLTNKEMVDDFNYVFKELKENYPFFEALKREKNIDFLGDYDKYLKRIKEAKNDQEFIDEMAGIMGELNNHHARIADQNYVDKTVKYYAKNWNSPSIYYEFLKLNKQVVRNRYGLKGEQTASETSISKRASGSILNQDKSANMTLWTVL